jgi:hypothetical protein
MKYENNIILILKMLTRYLLTLLHHLFVIHQVCYYHHHQIRNLEDIHLHVSSHGKILVPPLPPVLTGTNCTNSGTEGVKRKYPP